MPCAVCNRHQDLVFNFVHPVEITADYVFGPEENGSVPEVLMKHGRRWQQGELDFPGIVDAVGNLLQCVFKVMLNSFSFLDFNFQVIVQVFDGCFIGVVFFP